jgi:hypothetical protein
MIMTKLKSLVGLVLCSCLVWAEPAHADAVTHWNNIALQAITTGRPGPSGFLDAALVHIAIHDAIQSIEGRFEPYHVTIAGASGSPAAATAAAAHDVLVWLYPSQQGSLDMVYLNYLTSEGLLGNPGVSVGQQVAEAVQPLYRPVVSLPAYLGGSEPGQWRPTPSYITTAPPPAFAPGAFEYLRSTTPYTLNRPSQFRQQPPPPLTSGHNLRDYNEVKSMGARFNSDRTDAQTDFAYFWADNFITQLNRTLRGIAEAHINNLSDSGRLFALANLAASDAVISAWESKYFFSFWRPVTAIHEGNNDGNAKTDGDSTWEPLINTPNYPEYPSGANNVTAAVARTLELFFGTDQFNFSVTSNNAQAIQKTRTFTRFSQMPAEVVEARILQGIHFRSGDEEARSQGSHVAQWVFKHFLKPVR